MVARGIVKDIEHPRLGPMRAVRNPILLDHDSPSIDRYAPMLGEHSEEVLREIGYSAERIDKFFTGGVSAGAARKTPVPAAE
jgi:crotonobetainyl-CoA:carnitine CoA-transferase CaiB-like acyl-CoA transferase